ncbi:MAG: hypothetical protein KJ630_01150 [Proteobacteria bacterium]|nr:hypothetical protein [Pseudomonadota bacterium]
MLLYFRNNNEVISSELLTRIGPDKADIPCDDDFFIRFYFHSIDVGFTTLICQKIEDYEGIIDFMAELESDSKVIQMDDYFPSLNKFKISSRTTEG